MLPARLVAKVEAERPELKLAVLIDADNISATVIKSLLAKVDTLGQVLVKRIYGDFTSPASASWKKVLHKHSIKPMQQFAYTKRKNATDSALIIDAMDLLYTQRFDGFCLVSSDSDFTSLAIRLREEGIKVFGFGEQKTPESFCKACYQFVFIEDLIIKKAKTNNNETDLFGQLVNKFYTEPKQKDKNKNEDKGKNKNKDKDKNNSQEKEKAKKNEGKSKQKTKVKKKSKIAKKLAEIQLMQQEQTKQPSNNKKNKLKFPKQLAQEAFNLAKDKMGWASLSAFGSSLRRLDADFTVKNYGYKSLTNLVKDKRKIFVTEQRKVDNSTQTNLYLKLVN